MTDTVTPERRSEIMANFSERSVTSTSPSVWPTYYKRASLILPGRLLVCNFVTGYRYAGFREDTEIRPLYVDVSRYSARRAKWVQTDDCRLVANNSGSFANKSGFTPSIDAVNSGRKSRMIAGRSDYECRLLQVQALGANVRFHRLQQNLSQLDLAMLVGVRMGTISEIELAKTNPQVSMIESIALALQIDPTFLVRRPANDKAAS